MKNLNNRGMSLVETIVAIGVLGLMATVFATSFSESFKTQKMIENKDQATEFARSVSNQLYSQTTCSNGLVGTTLPANPGVEQEIAIQNYTGWGVADPITLQAGTEMRMNEASEESRFVRVRSLTIKRSNVPPQRMSSGGAEYDRHFVSIKLSQEYRIRDEWKQIPPRHLDLVVNTQPGQLAIIACNMEMTKEETCDIMGSSLDMVSGNCRPEVQCNFTGHYIDASCSHNSSGCPRDVPNEITGELSCPEGSNVKQSGDYSWSFQESCGKKCTRTVRARQRFYICIECQ